MRTLIVGAGALGSVFGYFLDRGGCQTSYLVRSARAAGSPIRLTELRRFRAPRLARFTPVGWHSDASSLKGEWDAVLLSTHSSVLDKSWLGDLRDRVGNAAIVTIGMAIDDRAKLERWWPADQIVEILPSILAFAPETVAQGKGDADFAYWVAPGALAVSCPVRRTAGPIIAALRAGGMAARFREGGTGAVFMSAINAPLAAAGELSGWDRRGGRFDALAVAAAREATAITAAHLGVKAPRLPSAWSVGLSKKLFELAAPFDAARFTQTNYTKVADQTVGMLDAWISEGRSQMAGVAALSQLRDALVAHRI